MSDPRPVITSVGTNSLPSLKKRTGRQNITPEQIGERFGLKPEDAPSPSAETHLDEQRPKSAARPKSKKAKAETASLSSRLPKVSLDEMTRVAAMHGHGPTYIVQRLVKNWMSQSRSEREKILKD